MKTGVNPNLLDRQFDVTEPDTAWASDFTFIRTHEGWMYLVSTATSN
ncbi:hypothetical protein [Xanthomonas citri]|nr:hypothetical protein [Xanthomonas citri]